MTKAARERIFNKYGGRCAYCGEPLQKGWHVDELEPCRRYYDYDPVKRKQIFAGYAHPERLVEDNQMPACASCNINKHSMSLKEFRSLIEGFLHSLNQWSTQYKIAKRYGLLHETPAPVVFYFEKSQNQIVGNERA